jgi:hypothetical protein
MWNWRFWEKPRHNRNQQDHRSYTTTPEQDKNIIDTIVGIRTVIDRVANTQQARYKQTDTHERARKKREYGTIFALFLAAWVAAWGIVQSHRDTNRALKEARTTAAQQHTNTLAALDKIDATINALNGQADIMRGQLDEMRLQLSAVQRAWIKITEIKLATPGLRIDNDGALLQISLKVRNTGNIPSLYGSWHVRLVPGPAGTGHEIPPTRETERVMTLESNHSKAA